MLTLIWLVVVLAGAVALAYVNASGRAYTAAIAVALVVAWGAHTIPGWLALVPVGPDPAVIAFRA